MAEIPLHLRVFHLRALLRQGVGGVVKLVNRLLGCACRGRKQAEAAIQAWIGMWLMATVTE